MGYSDPTLAILASREAGASRGLDHYVARTQAQKREIFRLRYEAYFNEGLIEESKDRLLADRYDFEESSVIYGVTLKGHLVSTIRLNVLSRDTRSSSSYDVFGDYLDSTLDRGETIVDGTRLAVQCSDSAARRSVLLYTLSLTALFASTKGVDYGAIAVREDHVPFYKRYGFDVVGEPRLFRGISLRRRLMMTPINTYSLQSPSFGPISRASECNGHRMIAA